MPFLRARATPMHEMSISEDVLRILEQNARTHGFDRVNAVYLEIGSLAGIDTQALRFSFEVVASGTLADDARLEIDAVPATAWCELCADNVTLGRRLDACPNCGSFHLTITSGDQMRVKQLEVE